MPNLSQTVFDSQLIANEQIMHRTNRMACVLYANWNDSFGSSHSTVRRHPFRDRADIVAAQKSCAAAGRHFQYGITVRRVRSGMQSVQQESRAHFFQ